MGPGEGGDGGPASRKSYRPLSHPLQGQRGGVVAGLGIVLGRGHLGGAGETGVWQVAVRVQERRVVLPVADVGEDDTNHSPDKCICNRHKTNNGIGNLQCTSRFILVDYIEM